MLNPPSNKKHVVLLSGRQLGKSMCASIFITHYTIFQKDDNVIILANKEATAKDILQKIKGYK